jgi:hypothetical protein
MPFKITQFGGNTHIVEYAKLPKRKRYTKKSRFIREKPFRTERSLKRAKRFFYRLCAHNIFYASTVTLATFTLLEDLDYLQLSRYISNTFKKINHEQASKNQNEVSYIGTYEKTKKGRFHAHLLLFDLPSCKQKTERHTRYIQNKYTRGYVDISPAYNKSPRLASYLSKYMAKSYLDIATPRAYFTSRNIKKPTTATLTSQDTDFINEHIIDLSTLQITQYSTKYLGIINVYTNKQNEKQSYNSI